MSHHFNESHDIEQLQFVPLEKIDDRIPKKEAETILKEKETMWIRRLCTLQPWGMNYIPIDTHSRVLT